MNEGKQIKERPLSGGRSFLFVFLSCSLVVDAYQHQGGFDYRVGFFSRFQPEILDALHNDGGSDDSAAPLSGATMAFTAPCCTERILPSSWFHARGFMMPSFLLILVRLLGPCPVAFIRGARLLSRIFNEAAGAPKDIPISIIINRYLLAQLILFAHIYGQGMVF